jgi:dTDP-4-dehydrorhamnose reductase
MRAVVIGGSGQIGGHLLRELAAAGHEATGTYLGHRVAGLVPLDAADAAAAASWLASLRPDVVFYPAGFTWVDGCERDPARAVAANLDQPLALARAAGDAGARFALFSTDYVFDGRDGPYDEAAPPAPLNVYGRAKREAEQGLLALLGDAALVLRTSWVFGPERQGKNFAYQVVRRLVAGEAVVCPDDMRSSPSYGPDVARAAVALAGRGASGIVHVAGPEVVTRLEFARRIADQFGLDPGRVAGRPDAELPGGAARPLRGGLLTPRLDRLLPGALRPLGAALADFAARLDGEPGWADPRPGRREAVP